MESSGRRIDGLAVAAYSSRLFRSHLILLFSLELLAPAGREHEKNFSTQQLAS
jgi:hypothetical protein